MEGEEILDPFNDNRFLGTLDFVKETLRVTEIYSYFSVCEKIIQEEVYEAAPREKQISSAFSPLAKFSKGKKVTRELGVAMKINETEKTGRIKSDRTDVIGDDARIALSSD